MSNPEQEFWMSFNYDHYLDQWVLKPGVAPMDILEVCRKKLEADRASVASATAGVEQACDHTYCTCESECDRCSKCGATI